MFSGSNIAISGGTFINQNRTSRGIDILLEWVATGAFHNSDELYDAPKCHPHTRVAVLDDIMKWVSESEPARHANSEFMMWLFGPAGAGKSAIAKRIAEIAAEMGMLIATFFFSRTSPTRSNKDRLIATLAYQLALSIPDTRSCIEYTIEQDPTIFTKDLLTQIDTLLVKPFLSISSTQIVPSKKLIIIDGLDECNDRKSQVAILEAISRSFTQHKLPIKFLVVSRPELDIDTSFNCNEPLRSVHRCLALDDTYRPDDDIRLFFSDKFEHIKRTHRLRSTIPTTWPTQKMMDALVEKSSGQFIYASTVVKFVESICHRPTARLNIILGVSPSGETNPFAELDALYKHLLSSVDNIQLTLRVLSLYVMAPNFAYMLRDMSPELFLSLEQGDIHLALINLSSIVTYHESSGLVEILHASLVDFLSDQCRSTTYYIDKAGTCTDFVRRILQIQYMKAPDGIRAEDIHIFHGVVELRTWILKGQLRSEILNFDLDAFINASIRSQYRRPILYPLMRVKESTIEAFDTWMGLLLYAGLEYKDKKEALNRVKKSLELRLQIYQSKLSDWRLQLLVTLAVTKVTKGVYLGRHLVPYCRFVDILLEMDDHKLHLADQNALDLRHADQRHGSVLVGMISRYIDAGTYASAALHCMRFLSNPPKYIKRNECLEMGLIYVEWKDTCDITLQMLCKLLQQANISPELVQFISNHDIHPAVQKDFSAHRIWEVDMHILAFLSRESACPNWRVISAVQRSLVINDQRSSISEENNASSGEDNEEWIATQHLTRRLDQCCLNVHY